MPSTVRGNLLLMLPFLLLFYLQLIHHQPWRDEINAWGLVVASHSLDLLFHNVHYEAHPALWYLLLYPGSKLTHDPWMMKLVQSVIGTGIYLAFAVTTPLRRAEQIFFYCSYYMIFEYTVMSRMYGVSLLFTLLFLASRLRHPERVLLNGFLLGIIANADVTSMILSGGLLLEYLTDWIPRRGNEGQSTPPLASFFKLLSVYVGFVTVSTATLWPAKDISWRTTGRTFAFVHNYTHLLYSIMSYLGVSFLPIHRWFPRIFWSAEAKSHPSFFLPLSILSVVLIFLVFRRKPRILLMIAAVATVGILFGHLIYLGFPRHFGIVYLAFIAGLWLLRGRDEPVSKLAYLLLAINTLAGIAALYGQWARPFADDYVTARWLSDHHLENAAFIGTPDTHVIGVPEKLQRPIYLLDCQCVDTYMKFSSRRDHFEPEQEIPSRLAAAVHSLHAPTMIFMTNRAFHPDEQRKLDAASINAEPLAQFTSGDVDDEHFFLYKVSSRTDPSPSRDTPAGPLPNSGNVNSRGGLSADSFKESRTFHAE